MLKNEKILVTGPASQVALPIVRELARRNEVHGLARFSRPGDREKLEALGVRCTPADLASGSLENVPRDFTYVLHFAVAKSGEADFDADLTMNAEGVGRLMSHCRTAGAFLHCSSAAVYEYAGHRPAKETDPLGDNHRVLLPTYSLCKIAAESVVRFCAREWNLPSVIVRLSVPYGDGGGWPWYHLLMMSAGHPIPVHPDKPNIYNPLHEDDYVAHIPRLLEMASVPATILNWGGSECVSIEDWCGYLAELTGLEPKLDYTRETLGPLPLDLERMHKSLGRTKLPWREGIRRMVRARNPELLRGAEG